MDFRSDQDVIDWVLSNQDLKRPFKEWEIQAVFNRIGSLRGRAVQAEDYAMKTTSDISSRRSEDRARDLRRQADELEQRAARYGMKKNRKPMIERSVMKKLTKRHIRRIIREERDRLGVWTNTDLEIATEYINAMAGSPDNSFDGLVDYLAHQTARDIDSTEMIVDKLIEDSVIMYDIRNDEFYLG